LFLSGLYENQKKSIPSLNYIEVIECFRKEYNDALTLLNIESENMLQKKRKIFIFVENES